MIWESLTEEERYRRRVEADREWRPYFAWFPVAIETSIPGHVRRVWMQWVEARLVGDVPSHPRSAQFYYGPITWRWEFRMQKEQR